MDFKSPPPPQKKKKKKKKKEYTKYTKYGLWLG